MGQLALLGPGGEFSRGLGRGAQTQRDQLHPCRGPSRGGDETRADCAYRQGDAGRGDRAQDHTYEKVLANIEEVRSREGYVIAVASEGDTEISSIADEVIRVPQTLPILSPLVTSIPLQLMAYYAALGRGCDVDMPRNLAKSVTVE